MRVTLIGINYTPEPTGIAPYTAGLAQGLAERGHVVHVLTGYPHYPWWRVASGFRGWRRREDIAGVRVHRLRHYVPRTPSTLRRSFMEVVFGLHSMLTSWHRPDVVVLVSPALLGSRMALARARLSRVPVVTWVQDIYTLGVVQTGGDARRRGTVRLVEKSLLERSTRVVAIHDRFRTYIQSELGVATPVEIVRNWSHVEPPPTTGRAEVRALHGWSDDEVVVLHAGNMGAKQGLENVVRAARLATDRGSAVRFVLLGDGNQRSRLEALDPSSGLQFIDPLPNGLFEETLAAADVLLVNELPGLTDMSVPSKLTTYYATGRPVVAAVDERSTTAGEVDHAGAGLVVDPTRPEKLLDAVERLVGDPELVARLGAAGRLFRERHLSRHAGIDQFERVLAAATSSA